MIILFECPQSLLQDLKHVHGANLISTTLFNAFVTQTQHTFIFITDGSPSDCNRLTDTYCKNTPHFFTTYNTLKVTLKRHQLLPTVAFINDINMIRMLRFRSLNTFNFPVIGLIHSLGTPSALQHLQTLFPLLQSNDRFICPSRDTQETLIKCGLPASYSTVIGYGIDTELFKPSNNKQSLRQQLGLPTDKTLMLLVTRINPYFKMDITPLLRQLPSLIKQVPDLTLCIVGNIQNQHYYEQLVHFITEHKLEKHVHWVTKPNKMHMYYQCADFFVSLSDAPGETFGLTVMEAMACGLPVIINNYAGYKDHFTHNKEGLYVTSIGGAVNYDHAFYVHDLTDYADMYAQSMALDHRQLTESIILLASQPDTRNRLGQAARTKIETHNQLHDWINHYFDYFLETSTLPATDT
ncbi:hypothetical protein DID76_04145, partial [Candidatus Marinamargulisbacteria bacterium SCGC AG-414-C22]